MSSKCGNTVHEHCLGNITRIAMEQSVLHSACDSYSDFEEALRRAENERDAARAALAAQRVRSTVLNV